MIALISGVMGNLQALDAVISDCRELGVSEFVCLGGTAVGGANSVEVAELVTRMSTWSLSTDFWDRCLVSPDLLERSSAAMLNDACLWAREQILQSPGGQALLNRLGNNPSDRREGTAWFMVGSPLRPRGDVLIPRELKTGYVRAQAKEWFNAFPKDVTVAITGADSWPGIIHEDGSFRHESLLPENVPLDERTIVCVGSVGMPQDRDPRASYALWDGQSVTFRRVEYDLDAFTQAIAATRLPRRLAERRALAR